MLAYRLTHHLGLVSFSTRSTVSKSITAVPGDFQSVVRTFNTNGYTSLWDALALAQEEISRYAKDHPGAKKRIIVLSDGEDNESTKTAQQVCLTLQVIHDAS